jgi:hypothetical protein
MDNERHINARKEVISMTDEQNNNSEPKQHRHSSFFTRAQERQERRMAKQEARSARRTAHAQRLRRDWTFEVKVGDKVYTFNWHWHRPEPQPQVVEETRTTDLGTENGADTQRVSQ